MLIFNNLAIFSEILTNGYQPVALDIIALLSILSGIFVIITVNPIVSVLFLISLFVNIACYLILIGVHFLGLAYLLVYVGGVSILFLFTIMLINIRTSEIYQNSTESIPLGFIVSIAFFYPVSSILPSSKIGYIDSEINNVFLVSSNK
jgi:NADH-ubiquinone oxidoreductase chain 6